MAATTMQPSFTSPRSRHMLGMRVDATSYAQASEQILGWTRDGHFPYVCVANVHMVMEAYDDPGYCEIVNGSGLVTPDGMPLVWSLRLLGERASTRVYGPSLTLAVLEQAAREGVKVGFYGSSPEVLERLQSTLRRDFPRLQIAYVFSPPFGPMSPEQDAEVVRDMAASGARILFVGLGCPKQERWMAAHEGRVPAVMLGVGAAFDFIAGAKPQAPAWMQAIGMEWVFRLATEPRRLWHRYARHNPRFVYLLARQILSPSGGQSAA